MIEIILLLPISAFLIYLFSIRKNTFREIDNELRKYKSFYHDIQLPLALLDQNKDLAFQCLQNFKKDNNEQHFHSLQSLKKKVRDFVLVKFPQVKINLEIDDEFIYFKGDLFRSCLNLINNSIEAHADIINISTLQREHYIDIVVSDNGTGFSKQIVDRMKKSSTTSKKNGLGIGIGHLRDLTQNSYGHLKIENEIGAKITLSLLNLRNCQLYQIEDDELTRNLWKLKSEQLNLNLKQFSSFPDDLSKSSKTSFLFVDLFLYGRRLTTRQLSQLQETTNELYLSSGTPEKEIDGLTNIGKFIEFS